MSKEANTNLLAQLQQNYEEASTSLLKSTQRLHQLTNKKERLYQISKKREQEEEEQWVTFQSNYDSLLKEKKQLEVNVDKAKQVIDKLHSDKEKIMELKTNKETEEQLAQWHETYTTAMTTKDEVECTYQNCMERLSELREIQSVYLKKREEEDKAMWKEFQERYDGVLKETEELEGVVKECKEEIERLKQQQEQQGELQEEVVDVEQLKEEEEDVSANSSPHKMDTMSSPQSQKDEEQQPPPQVSEGGGEEEDVALVTDVSSAIVSNSDDTAETISSVNNNTDSIEEVVSAGDTTASQKHNIQPNNDGDESLNDTHPQQQQGGTSSLQSPPPPNHMMAYDASCYDDDDDNTSLGATTISSRVSRSAAEFKKDLSALDKFLPRPADDESSVVSGRSTRSTSSRSSVRRRDVIKPLVLDEMSTTSTLPTIRQEEEDVVSDAAKKKIDAGTVVEEKALTPWVSTSSTQHDGDDIDNTNGSDKIVEQQSNPQCDDQQYALVVHDPTQKAPRPTNLEPEEGRAALDLVNDPPGETPNERPFIDPNDDSINNDSSSSSCSYIRGTGGRSRNVKWVDPKNVQDEDIDFDLLDVYERMTGRVAAMNDQSCTTSLKSQQQRRSADPPEDLPKNNYYPDEEDDDDHDDDNSKARMTKASILRDNRRIRIATISSGYKTANYFVREDLDTRIYFHELEDAMNYMSRRGYARMKKEDEEEWIKLIGRAHGVVKVSEGIAAIALLHEICPCLICYVTFCQQP